MAPHVSRTAKEGFTAEACHSIQFWEPEACKRTCDFHIDNRSAPGGSLCLGQCNVIAASLSSLLQLDALSSLLQLDALSSLLQLSISS